MDVKRFDQLFREPTDGFATGRKKVGGYVLGKNLGEGSFAKVRLGIHILTGERVAIKVVNKKAVTRREYVRKNMRREAAMLKALDHPNIVRLYEVMETQNSFYIVMDVAEGGDFMKQMTRRGQLSEDEARRYMRQIVSAVDHVHCSGMVHRDLKIENLLLDKEMNIKIIDFGLSNYWDGKNMLRTQCGSPAYAAPEIFKKKQYGAAADIWSIGINLFAMLAGRLPFVVDPPTNLTKLYSLILRGCKIPPGLSKECQNLIRRMLEPSEEKRITMNELISHPWITKGHGHITRIPVKTNMTSHDIQSDIITYLVEILKLSEANLLDSILNAYPNSLAATYQLLVLRRSKGLSYPDVKAEQAGFSQQVIKEMKQQTDPEPDQSKPIDKNTDAAKPVYNHQAPRDNVVDSSHGNEKPGHNMEFGESEIAQSNNVISSCNDGCGNEKPNIDLDIGHNLTPRSGGSTTPRTSYRECLRQLQTHKTSLTRSKTFKDRFDCVASGNRDASHAGSHSEKYGIFNLSNETVQKAKLTPMEIRVLSDKFIVNRFEDDMNLRNVTSSHMTRDVIGQHSIQSRALAELHKNFAGAYRTPPAPPNSALGTRGVKTPSSKDSPSPASIGSSITEKHYLFTSRQPLDHTHGAKTAPEPVCDKYKFKARNAQGKRILVWDLKALESPFVERARTMPAIRLRRRPTADLVRNTKEETVDLRKLGLSYSLPSHSSQVSKTRSRKRTTNGMLLPVRWGDHGLRTYEKDKIMMLNKQHLSRNNYTQRDSAKPLPTMTKLVGSETNRT